MEEQYCGEKTLDMFSGVDPRFPRGRQPIIWPIFPKNCFKLKKNRPGGGAVASKILLCISATFFVLQAFERKIMAVVHYVIFTSNI